LRNRTDALIDLYARKTVVVLNEGLMVGICPSEFAGMDPAAALQMQVMDGFEATAQIRRNGRRVPNIALTTRWTVSGIAASRPAARPAWLSSRP